MKCIIILVIFAGCTKPTVPPVKVETLETQLTRTPNIVEVAGTVGIQPDASGYRLEVVVPEHDAYGVALGKALYCVIEATGEKCDGQVDEVIPAPDTVLARISLKCRQPLQSGLPGRVQLLLGERFAMFVPKEAIHKRGELPYVFVAADGKAEMRLVKTGAMYLDAVEILSGVQTGERVIIASEKDVRDGQPISF